MEGVVKTASPVGERGVVARVTEPPRGVTDPVGVRVGVEAAGAVGGVEEPVVMVAARLVIGRGGVVVGSVAMLEARVAVPRVVVLAVPVVSFVTSRKVMAPVALVVEARVAVSWPVP